jgi:F0F1-type ATP synthase delta subunit
MQQERSEVLGEVAADLRETIVTVAGSVLADAGSDVTERAIDRVEKALAEASPRDVELARKTVEEREGLVEVTSASPLSDAHRERLAGVISSAIGTSSVNLHYREDAALLAGMEVTIGVLKISAAWKDALDKALSAPSADAAGKDAAKGEN